MPISTHKLHQAGVPEHLHVEVINALTRARVSAEGLFWAKWKVRIFRAGKIADILKWNDERLLDVRPDLAHWDIAPMLNITAHGDNVPWPHGMPAAGQWLNDEPESTEFKAAVAANYWCKGEHPRSKKSRKAWYRRNAGEYRAWSRGCPVPDLSRFREWSGGGVTVKNCGDAWEVSYTKLKIFRVRRGYEIGNLVTPAGLQAWYPIPGAELRAPVTWSTTIRIKND